MILVRRFRARSAVFGAARDLEDPNRRVRGLSKEDALGCVRSDAIRAARPVRLWSGLGDENPGPVAIRWTRLNSSICLTARQPDTRPFSLTAHPIPNLTAGIRNGPVSCRSLTARGPQMYLLIYFCTLKCQCKLTLTI